MHERSSSERRAELPQPSARSEALSARLRQVIPGGAHTYAKGDDQYPQCAPRLLVRGKGCRVWDVDGREFIEYGMGLRAVTLGHAFEPVSSAVAKALQMGTNFTRPALIELECAEALLELVPGAEMVKFCKDGSMAVDGAIKLARAHTGRDRVAICGDHPFFSTNDWFIGTTGMPGGIPQWIREHTLKFRYNDIDSLAALFERYPGEIACIVMEAARTVEPHPGYLEQVRDTVHRYGAIFILDEMITGFRWHLRGAQHVFGVQADLCSYGKALANGFSVSAIAGKRELMELGGFEHDRERVFLLSTTHGAEHHSLAAAMATMDFYKREPVVEVLHERGAQLRVGVQKIVDELQLAEHFDLSSRDCSLLYATRDQQRAPSQAFRTLFMQELVRGGILAPSFVVSYSHSAADIEHTVQVVGDALWIYKKALAEGVDRYLQGRSVKPVFRPRR